MRKKTLKIILLVLVCVILSFTGITVAKYVTELIVDDGELTMRRFYFRSNVLTETEDKSYLAPILVNGRETTVTLSNGANSFFFSDMDVEYEVQYYVEKDGEWVKTLETPQAYTLVRGNKLTTQTLTLTPIVYEEIEYNDVIVEAKAVSPYEKTLYARVQFSYEMCKVSYSYEPTLGVIKLTVTTNAEGGEYELGWSYPLIPDNADPNGILTEAKTPPNDGTVLSLTATLESYTTYSLHFFIAPEMRSFVDGEVENMTTTEIEELIQTVLFFEKIA